MGVGGDSISIATATDSYGTVQVQLQHIPSTTRFHCARHFRITRPAAAGQDDLTCSVDTLSVDSDGSTIVYTYVWTDDSGTIQQTTTKQRPRQIYFLLPEPVQDMDM